MNQGGVLSKERKVPVVGAALVLFIISTALYVYSLSSGFVYDDNDQILRNPWIREPNHIIDILTTQVWAFTDLFLESNYYRPVMHLLFRAEYRIFGLQPWGFHLVNVFLHALNTVMVFLSVSQLVSNDHAPWLAKHGISDGRKNVGLKRLLNPLLTIPFIAALIFAVHPINSEVANWVSAIPELTFTFFFLFAFLLYTRTAAVVNPALRISVYGLSAIFFFFSLLSKETAATFFFFILAYDVVVRQRRGFKFLLYYLPYAAMALLYFLLRTNALSNLAPGKSVNLEAYDIFSNVFLLTARYLGKLLLPINLSAIYSYGTTHSLFEPWTLVSIFILLLLAVTTWVFRRNKTLLFSLIWVIIPILPVLYASFLLSGNFSDRYLYLSSAGFGIIVAYATIYAVVVPGGRRGRTIKSAVALIALAVFILYIAGSINRMFIWQSDFNLWSDTIKKSPTNPVVNASLAATYMNKNNIEEAIFYYKKAINYDLGNFRAIYNLAIIYENIGDYRSAIAYYLQAIRVKPSHYRAYFNLAIIYEKTGNIPDAIDAYKAAIKWSPEDDIIEHNLANLYQSIGDLSSAIAHFKKAIEANPANDRPYFALALIYHNSGELARAESHYRESIRLFPQNADAHFNLGLIYRDKGNLDRAEREFKAAGRIRSDQ